MYTVVLKLANGKILGTIQLPVVLPISSVVRFLDETSTRANKARFVRINGYTYNVNADKLTAHVADVSPTE